MLILEDYLLPCLNKKLLGIECFGCGFQRSLLFLFQGKFTEAFLMYPAIYPFLTLTLFLIFNIFYKFKYDEKIKLFLVVLSLSTIFISYIIKLNGS
ncbi:MAG: DUF2752 domain-containing protein [Flavobacteriaceae bacterium]|nr:DUF2752 domain-containing protein [Flavobacteriaceae bacterium]